MAYSTGCNRFHSIYNFKKLSLLFISGFKDQKNAPYGAFFITDVKRVNAIKHPTVLKLHLKILRWYKRFEHHQDLQTYQSFSKSFWLDRRL